MNVLLDTDVIVDVLRGNPNAQRWLASTSTTVFAIPGVVAMELVAGCRNQAELHRIQQFLNTSNVVWTEPAEFERAYHLLALHHLASGLSIPDCIIAAMSFNRAVTLYTFNMRHFRVIAGLDVQEPYTRS